MFLLLVACTTKNLPIEPSSLDIHFTQGRQCEPFEAVDPAAMLEEAGIEVLRSEVMPTCEGCSCPASAIRLTVKPEDERAARTALGMP